jgi:tetratricopeptide (TPR) repeat protein
MPGTAALRARGILGQHGGEGCEIVKAFAVLLPVAVALAWLAGGAHAGQTAPVTSTEAGALAGAPTPDQWMATAQRQLRSGDVASAIASLQSAVALDPRHGAAGLLITTLHQAGRIEEAYALGDRYLRVGPRNPRALFRFGWLLAYTGEIARAEDLYRQLVELDKGGIYEAWGNGELAYLARARGDSQQAVEFMRRAVAAKPDDEISRVGLAHMMVNAGDVRAAVPLLEAELARNPAARGYGAMPAAIVLGWALCRIGDDAAAARWLSTQEADRAPGAWASDPARELAFLSVCGRRAEAIELAARTPYILLYGAPHPHDGMLDSLGGEPQFEALLQRSRARVNAERARLGWPPLETRQ